MKKIMTFGEIMLRLVPPSFLRIAQARSFDAIYAGAEANVAITLRISIFSRFFTRLPQNDLGVLRLHPVSVNVTKSAKLFEALCLCNKSALLSKHRLVTSYVVFVSYINKFRFRFFA